MVLQDQKTALMKDPIPDIDGRRRRLKNFLCINCLLMDRLGLLPFLVVKVLSSVHVHNLDGYM